MIFLITNIGMNVNGQSRTNKKMLEFISKSTNLTNATGWAYNDATGKWISNENLINRNKIEHPWSGYGKEQNFIWMQFTTTNRNGIDYKILLFEKISGYYTYPSIFQDWNTCKETHFFVMTVQQYKNMKRQIELMSGKDIIIKSELTGEISDKYPHLGDGYLYNEENLLAKITNIFEKASPFDFCFKLNSQLVDGKHILRFKLPEYCSSYSLNEEGLKSKYFEVDISEFNKILTE